MAFWYKKMQSPVGELKLVATERGLAAILWENDDPRRVRFLPQVEDPTNAILLEAEKQLRKYFSAQCQQFYLTLDFIGTEFQCKVWAALVIIPFGKTRSYGQIARQVGRPAAVRAVGAANGYNPITIIVPCHRVIGANGKLTGFTGGLETKAFLLRLESG